jgi:hypothetical protein
MKETKENNMMCMNCEGKGYLEDVISIGVSVGDPYLEPHLERCDECKVYANDEEALKESINQEMINEATV